MRRRAVLTGVLVWALVVAVVSAITWAVIDATGQDLLAGGDLVTDAAPAVTSGTTASAPAASRSPGAARSHLPRTQSTPGTGAPPGSPPSSAAPRSASPAPSRTTTAARTRTWQGPPGVVSVRCAGSRISLLSASPSNGYRIEVDRGQSEIEVHFKSSLREYQVRARCSDGTPTFRVESDGGEGGDD